MMAKIKLQVVKEKKSGFVKKLVWGIIALIGFLASIVTVIDFLSNNKSYLSRFVKGVESIFTGEEQKQQPEIKQPEAKKEIPVLKPQGEVTQPQEQQKDNTKLNNEPSKEETKKIEPSNDKEAVKNKI